MNSKSQFTLILFLSFLAVFVEHPLLAEQTAKSPEFEKEIAPLLLKRCGKCHAHGQAKGGFSINTREQLVQGGDSGASVIPGDSQNSLFMELITGVDPDRLMPENGPKLSDNEISLFKQWIDAKLPWPDHVRLSYGKETPRPLTPPVLATNQKDLRNPVDLILQSDPELKKELLHSSISDSTFLRRVTLDLVGLIPSPETIREFEAKQNPNKREEYIDQLLSDQAAYAGHWLTFWNDALRNAYRGTGFIDGGRKQLTGWLYGSLYENKPYDQFVRELINPVPGSEAFVKGIVWRGVVNASQRKEMQVAQNVSQVFLGVNLKCASCHDSFINEWKLTDAHALAAVFSGGPFDLYECDKPVGESVGSAFLFPELGEIDASKSREERMAQLADVMTNPRNSRFARTIVNRLWAQLMGRGIVEPLDQMSAEPWNQELIDWLAADLIAHQFDLKRTLRIICTSRAYQLPAVAWPKDSNESYRFEGPYVKRMTAAQYVDSLATLTKTERPTTNLMLQRDGRGQGGQLSEIWNRLAAIQDPKERKTLDGTYWIWNSENAKTSAAAGKVLFRKSFDLHEIPEQVLSVGTCDNEFDLFFNGKKVMSGKVWNEPVLRDLTAQLKQGKNVIAVRAINSFLDKKKKPEENLSPAGLIFRMISTDPKKDLTISSDSSWVQSSEESPGWETVDFDDSGWKSSAVIGEANQSPWNLEPVLSASLEVHQSHIRASLENNDPLKRALGRPSRDQVVTRRESLATMLQALELTNGTTLDNALNKGAREWNLEGLSSRDLISQIYLTSLCREPDLTETETALELIGSPATVEGIQDLLWVISMLPEFQLIH